jgi:hypothetical protein
MRVNQILRMLQLNPQIIQAIKNLGDPLPSHRITERILRSLINQPLKNQVVFLRKKGVDISGKTKTCCLDCYR